MSAHALHPATAEQRNPNHQELNPIHLFQKVSLSAWAQL
jgi:hypothetical protein